jgi:hypothetical protein
MLLVFIYKENRHNTNSNTYNTKERYKMKKIQKKDGGPIYLYSFFKVICWAGSN